ncbi:bifunctional methylenetetrahydrofolate dehydrogenase/methenyltetrahydrofolate cyclohydrolase FolD [Methanoplanus endosymbiosus]|uniref:Bifunctional protein FolD n=1 Tax=Methanoplanus endosymbiosus TaxID=33865 RepID=A0A9E7THS4_9EURY|nr:bifunctional methylenetetrahydrofolate dehydrogenase/methenyltetrahydrofolate cyclohydrolase FolD [Methanoplanus endosymbiosus]UUX93477.1 bifunctional methylenetetrahydrofolate dehydrogenase/methenyltetrahydrofolate cyclohydrolase FolD [Methanoplanus endosymbiosus]
MILNGRELSEKIQNSVKAEIEKSGLTPCLATVIVGEDPASQMYVRMKHKACENVGIKSAGVELPAESTTEEILKAVSELNKDPSVHGILVQLPLPSHADTEKVIESVSPEKDVDGFHPYNLGRLFSGRPDFVPCTPGGIMTILSEYGINPEGKRAVVIGRSVDVGRPMAALLINANATVTVCHSRTRNLEDEIRNADIVVSAIGRAKFIREDMIRDGAVVIDVGINQDDNGKLCGDVDFENVEKRTSAITPVPGGVGPMTIATLMQNTLKSAKLHEGL